MNIFVEAFQSTIRTIAGATPGKEASVFARQAPFAVECWLMAGRDKVEAVDRVYRAGTSIGLDPGYIQECLRDAVEEAEALLKAETTPNSIPPKANGGHHHPGGLVSKLAADINPNL